jgi:hypothetical protein
MTIVVHGSNWVNKSGTITTGGTAQVLAPANIERRGLWVQNVSDTDMWINEQGNAAATQPSMKLVPGALYEFPVSVGSAISIFCATTGKAFSAREW